MSARRGGCGKAFDIAGEVSHEGPGDPTPIPTNMHRPQIPIGQPWFLWSFPQAGNDVRDELYNGEGFVRPAIVERRVFEPLALPELQPEPEGFPVYARHRPGELALEGDHPSPGHDRLRPERGEVGEEHEVGGSPWGHAAEVVVEVQVSRGVQGGHLYCLYRRYTPPHGEPEETVEVAALRDGVRRRPVGGEEYAAGIYALLRNGSQELGKIRPQRAVPEGRPEAEPDAFYDLIGGDGLVAGPQAGGGEGGQLRAAGARSVSVGDEPPAVGLGDGRPKRGLLALQKAGPGGCLADPHNQRMVENLAKPLFAEVVLVTLRDRGCRLRACIPENAQREPGASVHDGPATLSAAERGEDQVVGDEGGSAAGQDGLGQARGVVEQVGVGVWFDPPW